MFYLCLPMLYSKTIVYLSPSADRPYKWQEDSSENSGIQVTGEIKLAAPSPDCYKKDLTREDLWKLSEKECSEVTCQKLETVWNCKVKQ